MNERIKISLSSYQSTASGTEEMKVSTFGTHFLINGRHFVKYNEETEDGRGNKVLLKFDGNLFEMTKSGEVTSKLSFVAGLKTEGFYKTVYGIFSIETKTKKLDVEIGENAISINLEYELAIDGEFVAECRVEVKIIVEEP